MTSGQASAATPTRGRPLDPGLEDRVFDAAIALYAETGWAGFSFEAVARRAGFKELTAWCVLGGLVLGFATDAIVTAAGA